MTISWKIFRIINIAEALLIAAVFARFCYDDPPDFNNSADRTQFPLSIIIVLLVISNCINNIGFSAQQVKENKLKTGKKILFWFLLSFFLLFIGFLVYVFIVSHTAFDIENIRIDSTMLICIFGIYILIAQVRLFIITLKKSKENEQLIIDEIGKQPE